MKKLLIILLIFTCNTVLWAKEHVVTGYVRTELGELMPYVDVYSADHKSFAITDTLGKFTLETSQDTITLFFSHIGYLTEKL